MDIKKKLYKLYITDGLTRKEICGKLNIGIHKLTELLKEHGIYKHKKNVRTYQGVGIISPINDSNTISMDDINKMIRKDKWTYTNYTKTGKSTEAD